MDNQITPIIAGKKPTKVDLEEGKNYFCCRCGRSASQPFCDGSHRGTEITPLKFTADKSASAALCQCKASANAPYCDGSHASLGHLEVGDSTPFQKSQQAIPSATPTQDEPTVARIHELARYGLSKLGHHGEMGSMGVPRAELPHWDDIQILTAQLAKKPLLDDVPVATSVTIGPRAQKPLSPDIFMNSHRPSLAGGPNWPRRFRHFISKVDRAPKRVPGGICRGKRLRGKLPKYAD